MIRHLLICVLLVTGAACGPATVDGPVFGDVQGTFDTEVFLPGATPPNFGEAVIDVTIDGQSRTLAQGASVIAIDPDGLPTLDPATALYFALQAFQYTDETAAEIFELRVDPALWVDGAEISINTVDADALFGVVYFDLNGQQVGADVLLTAIRGDLSLELAGDSPTDPVRGVISNLEMSGP